MFTKKLLKELQEYVDVHIMLPKLMESKYIVHEEMDLCESISPNELESFIENNRTPRFSQVLFNFIDRRSSRDADVYKKAGIDRRHFSKIRSNPNYHPGKNTVIALSLVLELNKKETDELLSSAGYSLSDCDTFDLVIQFCINKEIYDIQDVNMALDYFSLSPIAGVLE